MKYVTIMFLVVVTCAGCVSLNVAVNTGEGSIEKATDTKRTVDIGRRESKEVHP